jgi:putative tricarboxylic transport membrane protein
MLLGAALTVCGAFLGLGAWRINAPDGWRALGRVFLTSQAVRVATVLGLALIYTLVLVGWLPFWTASMLFIFSFIFLFEIVLTDERTNLLRSVVWGLIIAVVAGAGIFYVFERIFLVRLP